MPGCPPNMPVRSGCGTRVSTWQQLAATQREPFSLGSLGGRGESPVGSARPPLPFAFSSPCSCFAVCTRPALTRRHRAPLFSPPQRALLALSRRRCRVPSPPGSGPRHPAPRTRLLQVRARGHGSLFSPKDGTRTLLLFGKGAQPASEAKETPRGSQHMCSDRRTGFLW